jgi:Flp pilus assembly pilin Flp
MKKSVKGFIKSEVDGIGVVELILILLVIIGLVVIFREQINNIITTVFNSINEAIDSFN